jgi:hypothetical protein
MADATLRPHRPFRSSLLPVARRHRADGAARAAEHHAPGARCSSCIISCPPIIPAAAPRRACASSVIAVAPSSCSGDQMRIASICSAPNPVASCCGTRGFVSQVLQRHAPTLRDRAASLHRCPACAKTWRCQECGAVLRRQAQSSGDAGDSAIGRQGRVPDRAQPYASAGTTQGVADRFEPFVEKLVRLGDATPHRVGHAAFSAADSAGRDDNAHARLMADARIDQTQPVDKGAIARRAIRPACRRRDDRRRQ